MSEIKPALTAEEWAVGACYRGPSVCGGANPLTVGDEDWGFNGEDEVKFGQEYEFSGPTRHALAALALHGQPFGFTWEDVGALESAVVELCSIAERPYTDDPTFERWRLDEAAASAHPLTLLAARIAALLPPR